MTDDVLLDFLRQVFPWDCAWSEEPPPEAKSARDPLHRGRPNVSIIEAVVRYREGDWLQIGPRPGSFGSLAAQLRKQGLTATERRSPDGYFLYVRCATEEAEVV